MTALRLVELARPSPLANIVSIAAIFSMADVLRKALIK
jgi:hypothetical protein